MQTVSIWIVADNSSAWAYRPVTLCRQLSFESRKMVKKRRSHDQVETGVAKR
jgi:hypothetical protein